MAEFYLKRKIDDYLASWKKDKDRKPLIVKGCRQVGKTESIRHFAKEAGYESFIEINFVSDVKFKKIINDGYSAQAIVKNISLLDPYKRFIPGKTLIFFDEITEFPDIATSLKFFKQDGRFDVICSGSMLGMNYKEIESNSVGYKTDYEMRSMDFEEFLWAKGYQKDVIQDMLNHMSASLPFSQLEMDLYHGLFMDYIILGGMPAVVKDYIQKGTFEGSLQTQRQLILDYKEDIRKYAQGVDQTRILNVFNSIPTQLAKENKKFQVSKIEKNARFRDYRGCMEWLVDAGIINACYCLRDFDLPLAGNCDLDKFKLYFCDTGLLVSLLDPESQEDLRANKNLGVYKGALYENIVSEALVKSGYSLYYYQKEDGTLEEDFIIRSADRLIPIEVKAKNGRAKSLNKLIESDRYPQITYGFKFYSGNIGYNNHIYSFPYFTAFLLHDYMKTFVPKDESKSEDNAS